MSCPLCKYSITEPQGTVCRRNPPQIIGGIHRNGAWPTVQPYDYCGEFEPKVQPQPQTERKKK